MENNTVFHKYYDNKNLIEFEQDLGCVKEEKYVCIEENMIIIICQI
jgi:hypothetical protein